MLGAVTDDGKRLQACLKRLELLLKAKPNIGGVWGGTAGAPGRGIGFQRHMGLIFAQKSIKPL